MSYLKTFREALRGNDFCVLDTETTGLYEGEIIQIAVIHSSGKVLVDTLVKPVMPIPADATKIHGITDEMCKDAPIWPDVAKALQLVLDNKLVVVYNATYDRGFMHKTQERHNLPKIEWKEIANWYCAMEAYAEFYGDWNSWHQSYRWQKLTVAAGRCGIEVKDAHSALGDCIMALGVTQHLLKAESEASDESN
jgi:DNA polymerase-3 subunit epsilon